jgi:hypothetical protein
VGLEVRVAGYSDIKPPLLVVDPERFYRPGGKITVMANPKFEYRNALAQT